MLKVFCSTAFNCVVSNGFRPLYKRFFYPSFKNSKAVLNSYFISDSSNEIVWGNHSFLNAIFFKIEMILKNIRKYEFSIWSDVDIIICQRPEIIMNDLLSIIRHYDIAISPETPKGNINSGFYIVRSNSTTYSFFSKLLHDIKLKNCTEQYMMQDLLRSNYGNIRWTLLPKTYWNLTVGFPIPKDVKMVHANCILQDKGLGVINGRTHIDKKHDALFKLKKKLTKWIE